MPLWRCPHCSTPQAEAARCWVCRRSTTSCATCRHFRRAVASGFGTCGLDPRRMALTGAEMRACWAAPDPLPDEPVSRGAGLPVMAGRGSADEIASRRPRTFVPVDELHAPGTPGGAPSASTVRASAAGG
ncbi:MAG TPA: hypothetical protein VFY23_11265, partial [Candidatus Limnocylindrales bacterium]|nr:hypothetical protein [Candidatus Limnocylindrales bacterium]